MSQTHDTNQGAHLQASPGNHTPGGDDADGALAQLQALVAELVGRVQVLEEQASARHPEVSEEVLLAISAACAAYLGERAVIKQVHLRRGGGWASQGRAAAQQSHAALHGYGDRQAPLSLTPRRGTS